MGGGPTFRQRNPDRDWVVEHDNALEQNRIVAFTGLKKVKITRVLQKLEDRGVVEKKRAGNTNLVVLKI